MYTYASQVDIGFHIYETWIFHSLERCSLFSLSFSSRVLKFFSIFLLPGHGFYCTVKRVDEVVRHPHLVTQDQFTQVSKKVSNFFAINATSMSNLLDDNHRTYSNFLQMSTEMECLKNYCTWERTYIFRFPFHYSTTCATLSSGLQIAEYPIFSLLKKFDSDNDCLMCDSV